MVRQRLVDRPDAPAGLALADRGERRADRRRVVAVIVVHDDAAGLALALQAAADALEAPESRARSRRRPRPSAERRRGHAERVRGVVAAGASAGGR